MVFLVQIMLAMATSLWTHFEFLNEILTLFDIILIKKIKTYNFLSEKCLKSLKEFSKNSVCYVTFLRINVSEWSKF